MRWLVASGALAGCFSPSAPVGLPCGDGLTCPEGQTCDIVTNECGPASEALILRDDTAADFQTGLATSEVEIESQGFVGPRAYLTGAVRVTGYDGLLLPDLSTATFEDIVDNHQATGSSFARSSRILFNALNPPGLGIANPDAATVIVEGEVDLDAIGNWRFRLQANDQGFFEIARPGSDTFERVVEDVDTSTIGTFSVTETGWHRFRGAFQDAAVSLNYDLFYDPPNVNGSGFLEFPSDRIRVATSANGLIVDGFENADMLLHRGTIVSGDSLVDVTLGMDSFELPVGIGGFSLRWSGQLLIDVQDDYTFAIDSLGGHRLWIDGVRVADQYSVNAETSTTMPLSLAPGWHDIVLDVNKEGGMGPGRMSMTVTGGNIVGGVIPADHLRPVPGRVSRFVAEGNLAVLALPDGTGASATRNLSIDLPPSLVQMTDVTAGLDITAANQASLALVVNPPAGADITIANAGDLGGTGDRFFHVPVTLANAGSFWQFTGTDTVADTMVASITGAFATIVYDGGIAPFATTSHYESAVRDLGDAVAYERIAWTTRQAADPSAVTVALRSCETAEACASEPYVEVTNATAPPVVPRRFFQYRVTLTSNGDTPTALDAIELRYFVRGTQ